jgi:hypothetical protein
MRTTAHFPDAESATAYRDACNAAEGLPRPGSPPSEFPYGWTLAWASVVEIDGTFPIPVSALVPVPDGVPTTTPPEL